MLSCGVDFAVELGIDGHKVNAGQRLHTLWENDKPELLSMAVLNSPTPGRVTIRAATKTFTPGEIESRSALGSIYKDSS
jgi:hypothetical protein